MKTVIKNKKYTRRERRFIFRKTLEKVNFQQEHNLVSISMMAIIVRTIKGKLGFDLRTNDGVFKAKAQAIHDALLANATGFYTPAFSLLATMATQIAAFNTEMNNVAQHVAGAEGAKLVAKKALKITCDSALNYVNSIAMLNQTNAEEIITGAFMELVRVGTFNKQDFSVRFGAGTGEVKLISLAARNDDGKFVAASYDWRYSIDEGQNWIQLPSTVHAKTVATGMAVNVPALFSKRVVTAAGTSAWCPAIGLTPQ